MDPLGGREVCILDAAARPASRRCRSNSGHTSMQCRYMYIYVCTFMHMPEYTGVHVCICLYLCISYICIYICIYTSGGVLSHSPCQRPLAYINIACGEFKTHARTGPENGRCIYMALFSANSQGVDRSPL